MCIDVCVRTEVLTDAVGQFGHFRATCRTEVVRHLLVISEDGAGGADLCTHVTDRALTGRTDIVGTFTEILNDRTSTAFYGQLTGHPKDHILGGGPAIHLSGEFHTDELRHLELPGKTRHHVDGICTADTNGNHAQTTCVGCVGVRPDHHTAGKRVVLQHHLVDDACTGLPEADAVLVGNGSEEVIYFSVGIQRRGQILCRTGFRLDQVIAVNGRRNRHLVAATGHELQQGHLGSRILHGHTVRCEIHIVHSPTISGAGRLREMAVQNLFRQRQRPARELPGGFHLAGHLRIDLPDQIQIENHGFSFYGWMVVDEQCLQTGS